MTELLSPAGTLKNMRYAFAYGADAVYAGQPRYSLRVRNNEFNHLDVMADAIAEAHTQNKKFYIASNISPHNDKIRSYLHDMAEVINMRPDALIMSDPGLIMMVRERWPEIPIHLSVQANATNYATVKFWQTQGIVRTILSRELGLNEIEEIRQHCPEMELEVFVHGSLCIAYSGRCLLSGYMNHRDPNQGACTNACRWKYKAEEAIETDIGDIIPTKIWEPSKTSIQQGPNRSLHEKEKPIMLLEEVNRPGEMMPIFEDEHGTYIMNSKDLRAVQHVERLVHMGITSLKIEGRTKSHYYAARTAQVYRRAIDNAEAGEPFDINMMAELDHLASRGYTEGFYRRHVPQETQNYLQSSSTNPNQQFVGEVIHVETSKGWLTVNVKNRFELGDTLELITPNGNLTFNLDALENSDGIKIDAAPGSGHIVRIPMPDEISLPENGGYAMLMRYL
ncbi:MAG: tRNA 5-hydroxyuridine modification protein YegQ [Porticoccus sp.]|nr:tRNA 5-hydroxyuridine modification protein YegQ [Porticoccus sp.]